MTAEQDVEGDAFGSPRHDRQHGRPEQHRRPGDDAEATRRHSKFRRNTTEASRSLFEPGDDRVQGSLPNDEHESDRTGERAGDRPAETAGKRAAADDDQDDDADGVRQSLGDYDRSRPFGGDAVRFQMV